VALLDQRDLYWLAAFARVEYADLAVVAASHKDVGVFWVEFNADKR